MDVQDYVVEDIWLCQARAERRYQNMTADCVRSVVSNSPACVLVAQKILERRLAVCAKKYDDPSI